jgi:hypothetical protein
MCVWPIFAVVAASPAVAGPPFTTDDLEPAGLGHGEVFGFSAATSVDGDTGGMLAGLEVNYGAASNAQLSMPLWPLTIQRAARYNLDWAMLSLG